MQQTERPLLSVRQGLFAFGFVVLAIGSLLPFGTLRLIVKDRVIGNSVFPGVNEEIDAFSLISMLWKGPALVFPSDFGIRALGIGAWIALAVLGFLFVTGQRAKSARLFTGVLGLLSAVLVLYPLVMARFNAVGIYNGQLRLGFGYFFLVLAVALLVAARAYPVLVKRGLLQQQAPGHVDTPE